MADSWRNETGGVPLAAANRRGGCVMFVAGVAARRQRDGRVTATDFRFSAARQDAASEGDQADTCAFAAGGRLPARGDDGEGEDHRDDFNGHGGGSRSGGKEMQDRRSAPACIAHRRMPGGNRRRVSTGGPFFGYFRM